MENQESQAVLTMSRTLLPEIASVPPSNGTPHLAITLSESGVRQAPLPEVSAEIVRRGKEIYQQIRAQLEPDHRGRFLSIDVNTGEYAIGDTPHQAADKIITQRLDAPIYGVCIGFDYLGRG